MTTLRKAAEQEPVDSAEKASAFMEARLWEFIRMAAVWSEAKPDPRIWAYLMVYAPLAQREWVGLDEHDFDVLFLNEDGIRFAKYIEAKLKEKNT